MTGWPIMNVGNDGAPNVEPKRGQITVLPPAPTPKLKRVKLGNIKAIRSELAAVYRAVRRGDMDSSTGTRLTYILTQLANMTIDTELAERVSRLEEGE